MRMFDERDGERMPRESYVMRTPEKMAEVIASVDPFQKPSEDGRFLRGSRILVPINHIVIVQLTNGAQVLRRSALTAEEMSRLEARLMELQHAGDIRGYVITAAEDANFGNLLAWVESFMDSAEQRQLLSVDQDSLFR
jgi:hypothetical protein